MILKCRGIVFEGVAIAEGDGVFMLKGSIRLEKKLETDPSNAPASAGDPKTDTSESPSE